MTAETFRATRERLGMSQGDFAVALGYRSADRKNLRQQVNDMEGGRKPITAQIERLVTMFDRFGVPQDFL